MSAGQAQIHHAHPVGGGVFRAVPHPEHIAEFPHGRADITLAELDENVAFDGAKLPHDVHHQPLHRLIQSGIIHALPVIQRILEAIEGIDEIQLEAVQIPLFQGFGVNADEILPHLGITGIQGIGPQPVDIGNGHALEPLRCPGIFAHEGHAVPENILQAQLVHPGHMGRHVGNLFRRGLPVAAIGVTPGVIHRLPAVVHNDVFHAHFRRPGAFGLHLIGIHLLMKAIPAGIGGILGHGQGGHGRIFLLPPVRYPANGVLIPAICPVQPELHGVLVADSGGVQGNFHPAHQAAGFFPHPQAAVNGGDRVVQGHSVAILAAVAVKAMQRAAGGKFTGNALGPIRREGAVKTAQGMPLIGCIDQRKGPLQGQHGLVRLFRLLRVPFDFKFVNGQCALHVCIVGHLRVQIYRNGNSVKIRLNHGCSSLS